MELALNLIWCAIAIAAAVRFAAWSHGQTGGRRALVAIATVCVLALLFPIISATDDLQATVASSEDSSILRRITSAATLHLHVLIAVVVALMAAVGRFAIASLAEPASESLPLVLAGFARVYSYRGPPSIQR